jgi:hypothetical protein
MMSGHVQRTIESNTRLTTNWNTVDQVDDETRDDSRDDVNQVGIHTLNQEKFFSDSNLLEKNVEQDVNGPSYNDQIFGIFKTSLSTFKDLLNKLPRKNFDEEELNQLWDSKNSYAQSLCVMMMIKSPINDSANQPLQNILHAIKNNFKNDNFQSPRNSLSFDDDYLNNGQIRVDDYDWYNHLDRIIPFFNCAKNVFDELKLNFTFVVDLPELPENPEIVNREYVMDQLKNFPFKYRIDPHL